MKKYTIATIIAFALVLHFASGTSLAAQESKSSQSLEYELALQRGTQAVIWGLPAVSMKSFCGSMQTQLGAKENDIVYFSKPMVSRHGFLTANNNVPYVAVCLNTKGGPVVLDVPAASEKTMYFGSILDMWQTPIADVGPNGDDKGKGGKYLFLPPGYTGTVPKGYLVYRPDTYTLPVALRPVSRPGGTLFAHRDEYLPLREWITPQLVPTIPIAHQLNPAVSYLEVY